MASNHIEKPELSDESRNTLVEMFGTFDDNGDGRLNLDEFPNALSLIGVHPSNDDLKDLLRLFDTQGTGSLSIKDLVDNYHILVQHSLHGEELIDAFNKLDANKDGYLNLPELKKVLTGAGEKWSEEEASQLLEDLMKYDTNGDGKFDYMEFCTMFMNNTYPFKKPEVEKTKMSENFKMVRQPTMLNTDTQTTNTDTQTTNDVKSSAAAAT